MSSVSSSSSSINRCGSWTVCFGGAFWKKLNLLDTAALDGDLVGMLLLLQVFPIDSTLERLGLFRSFVAVSCCGDASAGDSLKGPVSGSVTGIPKDMGALEPENQELIPPLCFSPARKNISSVSLVKVGTKSLSSSRCVFSLAGLERSGLFEFSRDFVRKGRREVSDRW
jgi:hypothetical protein